MAAGKSVDSTLTKTATASSLFDVTIPHSGRRVGLSGGPLARAPVYQQTSPKGAGAKLQPALGKASSL